MMAIAAPVARLADGRNPRHVAIDDENEIGLRQSAVLERMVPVIALVQRIVMRKVDVTRHGFQHAHAEPAAEADKLGHGGGIATDIRGDDERPRGSLNRVDQTPDGGLRRAA